MPGKNEAAGATVQIEEAMGQGREERSWLLS